MRNRFTSLGVVILLFSASGCHKRTPHEIAAAAITEDYVYKNVRPLSDPVARLAHEGLEIPKSLLAANRITMVEVFSGENRIIYQDETKRPPNSGMITGVDHAHGIGLFFPFDLRQSDIEVRVNYSCDLGSSVAVHVIAPNPLVLNKQK